MLVFGQGCCHIFGAAGSGAQGVSLNADLWDTIPHIPQGLLFSSGYLHSQTPGWDPDQVAGPPEPALNVEGGISSSSLNAALVHRWVSDMMDLALIFHPTDQHVDQNSAWTSYPGDRDLRVDRSPQDGRAGKKHLHREEEYEAEREYRRTEKEMRGSCEILQNSGERERMEKQWEQRKWNGVGFGERLQGFRRRWDRIKPRNLTWQHHICVRGKVSAHKKEDGWMRRRIRSSTAEDMEIWGGRRHQHQVGC